MAFFLILTLSVLRMVHANIAFNIQITKLKRAVPELYTGIGLDWWRANDTHQGKQFGNAGIFTLNLSNQNLITLTSSLSPSILRLGGSAQNAIVYDINNECANPHNYLPSYHCPQEDIAKYYGCLNMSRWEQILQFATQTNLSFVFGLNPCYGRPSRSQSQNFSNVASLFQFTVDKIDKKYLQNLYAFEYGNELSLHIDAEIYATDVYHLHTLLREYFAENIRLIAPDIYGFSVWYAPKLLQDLKEKYNDTAFLAGFTFHEYPECEYRSVNKETVLNLDCLEQITLMSREYAFETQKYNVSTFLGEGAMHGGGGTYNVTDTFISSFYYIFALSEYISNNIDLMVRQALIGGYYELIDHVTFRPNPDFWLLWMFKMFVGNKLFESKLVFGNGNNGTAYVRAWSFSLKNDDRNGIVAILVNFGLNNPPQIIDVNVIDSNGTYEYEEYHCVGVGFDGLQTKIISVNGQALQFRNQRLPQLTPVKGTGSVTVKPKSIVFVTGTQL